MINLTRIYINQLKSIEDSYSVYMEGPKGTVHKIQIATSAVTAIDRIAGTDSHYSKEAHKYADVLSMDYGLSALIGIVRALTNDLDNGFLSNIKEFVHAEMFSDFLDMAD